MMLITYITPITYITYITYIAYMGKGNFLKHIKRTQ